MKRPFAALLLTLAAAQALAQPAPLQGTVSRVIDGDTLWLALPGKAPLVVRLRDIDAPEICQPGGEASRRMLTELALHKAAALKPVARDVHGRTVGSVFVDDIDIGPRMVEEGHAWSVRTRYDQGPLVKQERMARALGRGFHSLPGNVLPWDFRRSHGSCFDGPVTPDAVLPAAAPAPAAPAAATAFRCDGRTHCSQMTSCAEAKYFLAHCPGVKMDGDRDGVPCEQQWCGGR